jgi:hypothetical protein
MTIPKVWLGGIAGYETEPERKPLELSDGNLARMTDLIVKSAVKDALEENNLAADFYEVLDEEVNALLEEAARRGGSQRPQNRPIPELVTDRHGPN